MAITLEQYMNVCHDTNAAFELKRGLDIANWILDNLDGYKTATDITTELPMPCSIQRCVAQLTKLVRAGYVKRYELKPSNLITLPNGKQVKEKVILFTVA